MIFAFLNAEVVSLNFYLKTYHLPLVVILALFSGLGFLLGWSFSNFRSWRFKKSKST
ncbi:MAG: LapA family protein [Legionellaceae bacterium]|nr:LapA family protein [Legionellaceae bacterium]